MDKSAREAVRVGREPDGGRGVVRTSTTSRLYVFVWALLAGGALVYAALLGLGQLGSSQFGLDQLGLGLGERAGVRAGRQAGHRVSLHALSKSVEAMRSELAFVRSVTADMRTRLSDLEGGLAGAKAVLGTLTVEDRALMVRMGALKPPARPALNSPALIWPVNLDPAGLIRAPRSAERWVRAPRGAGRRGRGIARRTGSITGVVVDDADLAPASPDFVLDPKATPRFLGLTFPSGGGSSGGGGRVGASTGGGNMAHIGATKASARARRSAKRFGVRIAKAPTVERLRLIWALVNEKHADLLRGLKPRYVGGKRGGDVALLAGPLTSRARAKRLCATLAFKGIACVSAAFVGKPL